MHAMCARVEDGEKVALCLWAKGMPKEPKMQPEGEMWCKNHEHGVIEWGQKIGTIIYAGSDIFFITNTFCLSLFFVCFSIFACLVWLLTFILRNISFISFIGFDPWWNKWIPRLYAPTWWRTDAQGVKTEILQNSGDLVWRRIESTCQCHRGKY